MALEKNVVVDLVEVTENGCVHVRTKTAILENGEQISGTFHRHVVAPGDDYSNEDPRVWLGTPPHTQTKLSRRTKPHAKFNLYCQTATNVVIWLPTVLMRHIR